MDKGLLDIAKQYSDERVSLVLENARLLAEVEAQKQTIRGYRGILEDAGVHITHADIDEWHDSRERLLAVARAAELFQKTSNLVWLDNHDEYFELSLALAAVKDLL